MKIGGKNKGEGMRPTLGNTLKLPTHTPTPKPETDLTRGEKKYI
jgi:hypothetical protein